MSTNHYDIIIIGSGAGGGTLALKLAPSGKRILILERGGYLPREKENWDATEVFVKNRYVQKHLVYKDNNHFNRIAFILSAVRPKCMARRCFRLRKEDFIAHARLTTDTQLAGRYDE